MRGTARSVPSGLLVLTTFASCAAGPRGDETRAGPPLVEHGVLADGGSRTDRGGLIPVSDRRAAPEFVLRAADGASYAMAERRGSWVVVHLFPRVDTPDCACDMTAFTDHLWRFGSLDVEVVGITALSRERAARYVKKYGITAPILCDTDYAVARACGAFDPARTDPVVRTTLLVDPGGRIARRWDDVSDPDHIESILDVLDHAPSSSRRLETMRSSSSTRASSASMRSRPVGVAVGAADAGAWPDWELGGRPSCAAGASLDPSG